MNEACLCFTAFQEKIRIFATMNLTTSQYSIIVFYEIGGNINKCDFLLVLIMKYIYINSITSIFQITNVQCYQSCICKSSTQRVRERDFHITEIGS